MDSASAPLRDVSDGKDSFLPPIYKSLAQRFIVTHDESARSGSQARTLPNSRWPEYCDALSGWREWDEFELVVRHAQIYALICDLMNESSVDLTPDYDDILDLHGRVSAILLDNCDRRRLRDLKGADAEDVLTLLMLLVDTLSNDPYRFELNRAIRKLALSSGCIPRRLFLCDVECNERDPIGGGGFADVWRGTWDGTIVALKRLRIFGPRTDQKERLIKDILVEALLWRELKHPNILNFLGVSSTTHVNFYSFVSPWMENGTMVDYICLNPAVDRKALVQGVARGLLYLHQQDPPVVHGDLRGANVLIDIDGTPKLADFGLARLVDVHPSTTVAMTGDCKGTMRWMAPELFESSPRMVSSDIWAFGCVCLEAYTLQVPYESTRNDAAVIVSIMRGVKPGVEHPGEDARSLGLDDDIWQLMTDCWHALPDIRPDISRIISQLSRGYQQLPRPLVLGSVVCDNDLPAEYGIFTDNWRGTWRGMTVSLKQLCTIRSNILLKNRDIIAEAYRWRELEHKNILEFLGVTTILSTPNDPVSLVWSCVNSGNVFEYLSSRPETDRVALVRGVAEGLNYLHRRSPPMIHGDLRGANIHVDLDGQPKLSDYGLASLCEGDDRGLTRWMAPELFNADNRHCTFTDVWSFGCVCFEIFANMVPYPDARNDTVVKSAILRGDISRHPGIEAQYRGLSTRTWQLITECWGFYPEWRPNTTSVLTTLKECERDLSNLISGGADETKSDFGMTVAGRSAMRFAGEVDFSTLGSIGIPISAHRRPLPMTPRPHNPLAKFLESKIDGAASTGSASESAPAPTYTGHAETRLLYPIFEEADGEVLESDGSAPATFSLLPLPSYDNLVLYPNRLPPSSPLVGPTLTADGRFDKGGKHPDHRPGLRNSKLLKRMSWRSWKSSYTSPSELG